MKTEKIVSWLRDKVARAEGQDYRRMLTAAADRLVELEKELREEMHRHDRLQDFEVAEAQLLAEYKNTGLTPEQVAFLVSPDMQEIAQIMKECLEMIQGGTEVQIFGLPAERVMQLVEEEKAARRRVAKVIRCKMCALEGTEECPMVHRDPIFKNLYAETKPDDFCSYGVRRENDHNHCDD